MSTCSEEDSLVDVDDLSRTEENGRIRPTGDEEVVEKSRGRRGVVAPCAEGCEVYKIVDREGFVAGDESSESTGDGLRSWTRRGRGDGCQGRDDGGEG